MLEHFRASDSYEFIVRRYPAAGTVRGRIVFLHGIRSHGGWYEASSRAIAEAGFEVHFLDRRGAGLNTVQRGDCPSFHRIVDDVIEYLSPFQQVIPTFLAGISWGGKTAVAVDIRKPGLVTGVALLCPGLKPIVRLPLARRLRIALASQVRPTKRFPIPLNSVDLFTDNPEGREWIRTDPHGLTHATARFLFESFRFDLWLKKHLNEVTSKVLVLLAERDKIIDNVKTRKYLEPMSRVKSLELIEYPQAGHTLEFEPALPPVADLVKWMNR